MYQFIKLLMFVLVCSIPYKASAQENNLILFEKYFHKMEVLVVWAEFQLLKSRFQRGEDVAVIRFYENGAEIRELGVRIENGTTSFAVWVKPSHREGALCEGDICLDAVYKQEGSVVRVPILRTPREIAGTTAKLFVLDSNNSIIESSPVEVDDALISSASRTQFMEYMEDDMQKQAIRYRANKEVPSVAEACAEDYADRLTKPYECMRSLIPGVQQLHNVLAYLRSNAPWVPAVATTSPYVRIIDDFREVATHGEYVSLAFESVSANKRNTCNDSSGRFNGISYCYLKSPAVEQVNLSSSPLVFERVGSRVAHISREQFLSQQIRAGVATGNTLYNASSRFSDVVSPVLGPHQNGLGDVMDTGYLALVGGWHNLSMINLLLRSDVVENSKLTGITEEQIIDFTNRLDIGARSCEKDGGVPATKKWCVLFPHHFFYFEEGVRREERGTSGAVALYNGVFDLLRTIYHPVMTASETDALIRSCAIDTNPDGYEEVLDEFPEYRALFTEEVHDLLLSFYGESGIDSVTGVGKGDLSCLFEEDGSLIANSKSLIKSSLL